MFKCRAAAGNTQHFLKGKIAWLGGTGLHTTTRGGVALLFYISGVCVKALVWFYSRGLAALRGNRPRVTIPVGYWAKKYI